MSSPLWEKCLSHLEGDLSAQQLNTWLRPLQAIETEDSLRLLAPNPYVKAWVQEQLEQQINSLIHNLSQGLIARVAIEVGTVPAEEIKPRRNTAPVSEIVTPQAENKEPAKTEPAIGSPMNPLFTFDNYVEGKSNQIARAA
ncbi:MAG: chromosomal replication initiator protein DnaA, partial [Methylophaga sp.]|nr:chromosomal replication initiator protein DnaA [Methylophaga sp.]